MQRRAAIVAVVVIVAAVAALVIRPPIKEPSYSHELIAMKREVDSFEVNFFQRGGRVSIGAISESFQQQQRDAAIVDQQNMDRLRVLIDRYGWPTKRQVGPEALQAAHVVAQRAPDVGFKELVIGLIEESEQDNTPEYARLVDQVAVNKGEPQTYGTAYTCNNGRLQLSTPVKQTPNLTQLRKSVGLGDYDRFPLGFCFDESQIADQFETGETPPVFDPGP